MKTRILTTLALAIMAFALSFNSFGQTIPDPGTSAVLSKNTITRTTCLSGYDGCYDGGTVILKMSQNSSGGGIVSTQSYAGGDTNEHLAMCSYAKVIIGGYSNSIIPLPKLPTITGESVVISVPGPGGADEYTVYIKKNATRQFTLSVAHNVL